MSSSWCDDPLELLSFICFFLPFPSLRWLWLIGVLPVFSPAASPPSLFAAPLFALIVSLSSSRLLCLHLCCFVTACVFDLRFFFLWKPPSVFVSGILFFLINEQFVRQFSLKRVEFRRPCREILVMCRLTESSRLYLIKRRADRQAVKVRPGGVRCE